MRTDRTRPAASFRWRRRFEPCDGALTLLIGFSTERDGHGDCDDRPASDGAGDGADGGPAGERPGESRPPVAVDEGEGKGTVVLSVGEATRRLTPAEATRVRAALGGAIAERRAFVHTVGERRPDGSYVVRRRDSDATGNSVTFDAFEALCRLFERLPATVDAETVGDEREGVTGSRRHLVVWHLAEHPAFDARVESRSPLRVRTEDDENDSRTSESGRSEGSGERATGDDD